MGLQAHLEEGAGGKVLYEGPLNGLVRGAPLVLPPRDAVTLRLAVRLPAAAGPDVQADRTAVRFTFTVSPA